MMTYIAGPISGMPDRNAKLFTMAEMWLQEQGKATFNALTKSDPQHEGACPSSHGDEAEGHAQACWIRAGLREMLTCNEICLLPGWEASVGARLELQVAAAAGLRIIFFRGRR